jgi:predicted dithiol-disulfide oxidoreductase (DUF899 family)
MSTTQTQHPRIVSRDEWLAARKALLAKEREVMRQQDAVNAERRRLPMVQIEKDYVFDSPDGTVRLIDLFEGRCQLIVYHFMFDPNDPPPGKTHPWTEGCPGCSYVADNIPNHLEHLHVRNTTLVLVSRAAMAKITPFKKRMGWNVPWVSSFGSDFNYDFHVTTDEAVAPVQYNYKDKATLEREALTYHVKGEQPGLSCFTRLDDTVYHTYSTYGRGLDALLGTYHLLDLTAFGRQEEWEESPAGWPKISGGLGNWVQHHDKYGEALKGTPSCCKS